MLECCTLPQYGQIRDSWANNAIIFDHTDCTDWREKDCRAKLLDNYFAVLNRENFGNFFYFMCTLTILDWWTIQVLLRMRSVFSANIFISGGG